MGWMGVRERRVTVRIDRLPARRAAWSIVRRLQRNVAMHGSATMAVSGGSTTPALIAELLSPVRHIPWDHVQVWQVDERVAPDGDPARNANQLVDLPCPVHLMPVTAPDLGPAADDYAATLPARFDVVHLGIGTDGHTASWVPGDPIIDAPDDVAVAITGEYQGHVRMSLTPSVVNAARGRLVYVVGENKAPAVAEWLEGTPTPATLPVSKLTKMMTVAVLDRAAASALTRRH